MRQAGFGGLKCVDGENGNIANSDDQWFEKGEDHLKRFVKVLTGTGVLSAVLIGSTAVGYIAPMTASARTNASASVNIWDIQTGAAQQVIKDMVSQFDKTHPSVNASVQWFQNGPFKQKLLIAMGAHNPPDVFTGWGGGILQSYVNAHDVYDLTSALNQDPKWKNMFLPSVMPPVTFHGHIYGIPNDNVQPVFMFYNKTIFKQYHLTPPKTLNQLQADIRVLNKNNVIPIALGGKDLWPDLMYEEYLVDRMGGPKPFDAVVAGKKNAWSNPAFIKANTIIQQLVKENAFESGFSSVSFDTGTSTALLYSGKAAMELMGSWEFSGVLSNDKSFIQQKDLGWFAFPSVPSGKGNAGDIAGNPSNYYSVSTASKNPQAAVTFLKDAVLNKQNADAWINIGSVPPVKGIEADLKKSPYGDYLSFTYDLVKHAPNFQASWDQALSPSEAQELLTDLGKLFLNQMTPAQLSQDMNTYIGTSK